MRITLATATMDPAGVVNLDINQRESNFKNGERRTTRTKTLDGKVFIYDGGFSHGDRTLDFRVNPISPEDQVILLNLRDNYTAVTCAVDGEFFLGVVNDVRIDPDINIIFLVKSRLSV